MSEAFHRLNGPTLTDDEERAEDARIGTLVRGDAHRSEDKQRNRNCQKRGGSWRAHGGQQSAEAEPPKRQAPTNPGCSRSPAAAENRVAGGCWLEGVVSVFHVLLLDRSENTFTVGARHSDQPQQANARIWYIDQSLFGKWSLGEACQPPNLAYYGWRVLATRRFPVVPDLGNLVADWSPGPAGVAQNQLRGTVLLSLEQHQLRAALNRIVIHTTPELCKPNYSLRWRTFHAIWTLAP